MMKTIMIALLALTLTNCAQNTYKVKQEAKDEGRVLNQVPQWYIDAKVEKGLIKTVTWYLDNIDWCKKIQQNSGYKGQRLGMN